MYLPEIRADDVIRETAKSSAKYPQLRMYVSSVYDNVMVVN